MIIGRTRLKTIVAGQFGLNWYAIDRRCVRPGQGEIAEQITRSEGCGVPPQRVRASSFPRKRESRATALPLPWTPRFRGGDGAGTTQSKAMTLRAASSPT